MVRKTKLLDKMAANPQSDWKIADVETLCKQIGLSCRKPSSGSHYMVTSELLSEKSGGLTIPARRPIKPYYIRQLANLAKAHLRKEAENGL